jgi:Flp pilus assembly protein TadG
MTRTIGRRAEGDQGAALVEFALLLPFLAILICGTLDLGRAWQLQNRLSNAAREAAAAVQFSPANVNAGCNSGNNANDRAREEEQAAAATPGYAVTVAKVTSGTATAYTGCGTASGGITFTPGDTLRITVQADFALLTPLVAAMTGDPIKLKRSVDVVVQG